MTRREVENVEALYGCLSGCDEWVVEGRLDADGQFEPYDYDNENCGYCGKKGEVLNGT